MTRKQKLIKDLIAVQIAEGKELSKSLLTYGLHAGLVRAQDVPPSALPDCFSVKPTPPPLSKNTSAPSSSTTGTGECEFNYPDEDRFYPLMYSDCPICRGEARLWREHSANGTLYRVTCMNIKTCGHKTPWCNSSAKATRIWKVTATLHRE